MTAVLRVRKKTDLTKKKGYRSRSPQQGIEDFGARKVYPKWGFSVYGSSSTSVSFHRACSRFQTGESVRHININSMEDSGSSLISEYSLPLATGGRVQFNFFTIRHFRKIKKSEKRFPCQIQDTSIDTCHPRKWPKTDAY